MLGIIQIEWQVMQASAYLCKAWKCFQLPLLLLLLVAGAFALQQHCHCASHCLQQLPLIILLPAGGTDKQTQRHIEQSTVSSNAV